MLLLCACKKTNQVAALSAREGLMYESCYCDLVYNGVSLLHVIGTNCAIVNTILVVEVRLYYMNVL